LYSNRCAAYQEQKDWDKALEDAEKCIQLDASFPKGHFRKGQILAKLDRFDEAIKALLEARDLAPKDEEILLTIENVKKMKK